MAQTNVELMHNIQRIKLSKKEVKEILIQEDGKLSESLTNERFNPTYTLNDSRIIVDFGTHGYLYNSAVDLKNWIHYLKKQLTLPSHILKNRLLFGKNFPSHTSELIDTVVETLKLKDSTPSLKQLKIIDKIILKQFGTGNVTNNFFSGMVAYVGEVFKSKLPDAVWISTISATDSTIFEPYIYSHAKKYNPFFLVYRELYEELPETNKISIYDRVIMELEK